MPKFIIVNILKIDSFLKGTIDKINVSCWRGRRQTKKMGREEGFASEGKWYEQWQKIGRASCRERV